MPIDQLAGSFPPRMAAILRALEHGDRVPMEVMVDSIYGPAPAARDPDMALKVVICQQREKLAGMGWRIGCIRGAGYRLERTEE